MMLRLLSQFTVILGIFTISVVSLPLGCESVVAVPSEIGFRAFSAPCAFHWQCTSTACSADSDNGTCGVCLDRRLLGERCDGPLQICSATAVCTDGICKTTKKGIGEPCEMLAKGQSDDCDIDLFCAGEPGTTGVCAAKPKFGEACGTSPFASCARGGYCERGICTEPREGGLGDTCDSRPCMQGLACHSYDDGHTCEEPNVVNLNESCAPHIGNLDCVKDTQCELTGGPMGADGYYPMACLAGKTEGEECASSHCAEGLVCSQRDGETGFHCHRLGLSGEVCSRFDECAAGLECRKGTCLTKCQ